MMAPKLAALVSLPAIAKMVGKPRRTLFRQLLALHARDREAGGGEWLTRIGVRRVGVNLSALRRAHPALFEQRYVDRDEFDALRDVVGDIKETQESEKLRLSASLARIRRLETSH